MSETVKVIVRVRPFNKKETTEGHSEIVQTNEAEASLLIKDKANACRQFVFDSVFSVKSTQTQLYSAARPVIMGVLNGFNGTIFAYGQTSSGKSFTMEGVRHVPELRGIIPNAFEHIYSEIQKTPNVTFLIRVSYLEIYNEDIRDLLTNTGRLEIKEHPTNGIYVKDLTSVVVTSPEDMAKVMEAGSKHRSVGATLMNDQSSRSHSIFQIIIEMEENKKYKVGKLALVDLAGSERQEKTKATGDRLKEANKINLSLTTLGIVIKHLVDGKSTHVPYRDSKLTRLLQDSLGGNSKTLMIATLSPASYNYDESLSTLRYAARAKLIKNKPKVNEDSKDALLRQFEEELKLLKTQLDGMDSKGTSAKKKETNDEVTKRLEEHEKKKSDLLKQIQELENQFVNADTVEIDSKELERLEMSKKAEVMEEERKKERLIKAELQEINDKKSSLKTNYSTLEEELMALDKKLLQSKAQLKESSDQLKDLSEEHIRDLQQMNDVLQVILKSVQSCEVLTNDLFEETDLNFLKENYFEFLPKHGKSASRSLEFPSYEELIGTSPRSKKEKTNSIEIPFSYGVVKFKKLYTK